MLSERPGYNALKARPAGNDDYARSQHFRMFSVCQEAMVGQRPRVSSASWNREVTSAELPVLVEFWSRDSAPCRFEDPVLEAIADSDRRLKVLRVDVDAEPALVDRFDVRALPTMVLFLNGVPVHRMVGYHEPRELNEQLAGYLH